MKKLHESSESIIDQFKDFRTNITKKDDNQDENIQDNRQNVSYHMNMNKKPGFILHRSPTPKKGQRKISPFGSNSPSVKINKRMMIDRTPPRNSNKWKI